MARRKAGRAANQTGTIYADKQRGAFVAQAPADDSGYRPKKTVDSRAGGEAFIAQVLADREALRRNASLGGDRAEHQLMPSMTVRDYGTYWLEKTLRNKKRSTLDDYYYRLHGSIGKYLGDIKLSELTLQLVNRWIERLERDKVAASSIRQSRGVLRLLLNSAVDHELISRNVALRAEVPRMAARKVKIFERDEIDALLRVMQGDQLQLMLRLALTLGLRLGEILGLRWTTVDWQQQSITIAGQIRTERARTIGGVYEAGRTVMTTPKSESSQRELPLTPQLREALNASHLSYTRTQEILGPSWNPIALIFHTGTGTCLNPSNVERSWRSFRDLAFASDPIAVGSTRSAIRVCTFHYTRHTCATWLDALHATVPQKAAILGHGRPSDINLKYTHPPLEVLHPLVTRLEREYMPTYEEVR